MPRLKCMTKKEKALKQELLANKQQQINNYQQSVQQQIQKENQHITQAVINDINAFVKEYGKENGYKIILGARGNGNIMYADSSKNITKEVLIYLNKKYQGDL